MKEKDAWIIAHRTRERLIVWITGAIVKYNASVAQLVEQWPFKPTVVGSIPTGRTEVRPKLDKEPNPGILLGSLK